MVFKYRYVDFGIKFVRGEGVRTAAENADDQATLYANEVAMDVGGECWGYEGRTLPVFDHHFLRHEQYTSATLAVLDNAQAIRAAVGTQPMVWLVTHRDPDFDAFCSMYLVRVLLQEEIPAVAWREFNPFDPDMHPFLKQIPKPQRWIAFLGAYASLVDNCRRLLCPKERSLHSILYAALQRNRDYLEEDNGALEFFDEVRRALSEHHLNPLFDSVLENSATFAPELAMLDREVLAYERDVRRARKTLVHLCTVNDFSTFFDLVKAIPLTAESQETGAMRSQTDGIYLRDPECILFKEWARLDTENSSMGQGFLFTAVAYSSGRPRAEVNRNNYFFSVDPERADGRHLYDVWESLEREEIAALQKWPDLAQILKEADNKKPKGGTIARQDFETRGGENRHLFNDPWFDGHNYNCTIVATPNRGSYIAPPGSKVDLSDDKVASIVIRCLEHSIYSGPVVVRDLSAQPLVEDAVTREVAMGDAPEQIGTLARGFFRVAAVPLESNVDLESGSMLSQVAASLWRLLNPAAGASLPADFLDQHVSWRQGWVAVWSREGLAVAFKKSGKDRADALQSLFGQMIQFMGDASGFIHASSESDRDRSLIRGVDLIRTGAQLTHQAALPDNEVLQRFLEASRLNDVVKNTRDVQAAAAAGDQRTAIADGTKKMVELQENVEVLEIVIASFYATELMKTLTEYIGLAGAYSLAVSFAGVVILSWLIWYVMTRRRNVARIFILLAVIWLVAGASAWLVPQKWSWMLKKEPGSTVVEPGKK